MSRLLEIIGLEMSLGARRILSIDRLLIQPGGSRCSAGPTGRARPSLLKIMAGLLRPDRAQVRFAGHIGAWRRVRRELRRHTVYLHQHPYPFRSSVADNAAYGLRHKGLPRGEIRAREREAVECAGLGALAGQGARCLSGGEVQHLSPGRTRLLDPNLMLPDEPVSHMDPEHRAQTYVLL
jgi:tungstate transport system ATP-binding protein